MVSAPGATWSQFGGGKEAREEAVLGWARNAATWKWAAAETTKWRAGEPVS